MKIDDSNKRYSMIITGILLITTVVIFVTFTVGAMDQIAFSDNGAQPTTEGGNNDSENMLNNKGDDDLVSESKRGCDIKMKTEPGTIEVDYELSPCYELPLCFDEQAELDELNRALNITLAVCGGYKPQTRSNLSLIQEYCGQVRYGEIDIDWVEYQPADGKPCCCWTYYYAVFTNVPNICLIASTQMPTNNILPSCMSLEDPSWPSSGHVESKKVDVDINIYWEGCHFWTIPTSDFQFPGAPTPHEFLKNKKFVAS
jgi:hypothetical protein